MDKVEIDEYVAWTFSDFIVANETHLGTVEENMNRLFEAGLGMTSAL